MKIRRVLGAVRKFLADRLLGSRLVTIFVFIFWVGCFWVAFGRFIFNDSSAWSVGGMAIFLVTCFLGLIFSGLHFEAGDRRKRQKNSELTPRDKEFLRRIQGLEPERTKNSKQ